MEADIGLGLGSNITFALGSARFCPEWRVVLETLYPSFIPKHNCRERLKIVIMLPHWNFHVDQKAASRMIETLRNDSSFYLVVKEHTRSGTGDLPEQFAEQLGFECASTDTSSVALIKWADVVINCNTSVGIDVLLDGKVHLIPRYIQNKRTIFEETNSGLSDKKRTIGNATFTKEIFAKKKYMLLSHLLL